MAGLLYAPDSSAAPLCKREDIEFYLANGFNQSQITAICSGTPSVAPPAAAPAPAPAVAPVSSPAVAPAVPAAAPPSSADADALFLSNAIDGFDVVLADGQLQFTRKLCVDYGERDPGGFKNRACPMVRHTLALKQLKVLDTGRRFLVYGQNKVVVSGETHREIVSGLDEYGERFRDQITSAVQADAKTEIPVRPGISIQRVTETLTRLAG